jgi:hypothetical protein
MLVQFSVENFLSFDQNTVLSMRASSDASHPEHLAPISGFRGSPLLRGGAIYGANGAGKSNLLKAVAFAQKQIVRGMRPDERIPVLPFRLRTGERPSRFQFHFIVEALLFDYGFAVDTNRVVEEWLYATPLEKGSREQVWFERTTEGETTNIQFGSALTGRRNSERNRLQFLEEGTRPNQLFLTEAIERNVSVLKPAWNWFRETLLVLDAESRELELPLVAHKNIDLVSFMGDFLRQVGTGIDVVTTAERPVDFSSDFAGIPKNVVESIRAICTPSEIPTWILPVPTPRGIRHLLLSPQSEPQLVQLKMHHSSVDKGSVLFDLEEESDGTQRLIHLLPLLTMLCGEEAKVVLLDELDRRLHTHLSRAFVQSALRPENPNSQFLFTTHDTNLLDLDILRRDEIWFVEKDKGGASNLYSLAEFNVRPDLQIEKGYLNGRFGAIPLIGDLSRIGLTPSTKIPSTNVSE